MLRDEIDQAFLDEVHDTLARRWPKSATIRELADELDEDWEKVRLALRDLFRDKRVSQDADDWNYRTIAPLDD